MLSPDGGEVSCIPGCGGLTLSCRGLGQAEEENQLQKAGQRWGFHRADLHMRPSPPVAGMRNPHVDRSATTGRKWHQLGTSEPEVRLASEGRRAGGTIHTAATAEVAEEG